MDYYKLPLGFSMALAENPEALNKFSSMPESDRQEILRKAHTVCSRSEMQALVDGLFPRN